MIDLSNNSISLAGEFAVLSQLTLKGFDSNMTLGNTKNVDILVSDPVRNRMFKIEVKTHYRNTPSHSEMFGHHLGWIMSKKNEEIRDPNLFYVFVCLTGNHTHYRFFIVPSNTVADYVKNQHLYWLQHKTEEGVDSDIRRFRIGLDDGGYVVPTVLAKDYENRWDLLQQNVS